MTSESKMYDKNPELFFAGLEIGAVSIKSVRKTREGDIIADVIQHGGNPRKKVEEIIDSYNDIEISNFVVTGQAAKGIFNLPYRSETECMERAISFHNINPDILLSLGGETFSVYTLKNGLIKNIISTTKCAAGTGEFIVQQFQRMGLSLDEGLKASDDGKLIQLATRCSVHCKSDATHKLNKGECSSGDIAKSLIYDLAKKICKMIELAQWPSGMIVLSGGVVNNEPFVEYLRQILNDSDIRVLPESPYLEAFGASLYAVEIAMSETILPRDKWLKEPEIEFETLKPLKEAEKNLDYRVLADVEKKIIEDDAYILGVDAGSTTTKAVLFNANDGSVGASCYLRTLGNPVLATKNCLTELIDQVGEKSIKIIQTGVTGSGREMVSVYLDNCLSFNEILAHARAASEEVPDVDTVFEIGGQDSKFISFIKGIPIDYAMNEGCSAGTGSFLEESASVDMNIGVMEISGIAERSANPIAFGERCAAFINTDLRNALQQGALQDDVVAGLVYSIADNYISRVVGSRHIGDNLLFLGGVALNKSVALAISSRTNQKIVVPAHPELMGCVGTGLMAKDLLESGDITEKIYKLENLLQGEMKVKGVFRCKACENNCEIQKIQIRGKNYPFGGLCSKFDIERHKDNKESEGLDFIEVRNKMMFEEFGPQPVANPRGKIGIPLALATFELFPFFSKLINELGYEVVLSNPSKEGNSKTMAAVCYPCEIAHGEVFDLLNRDVDYIFLPFVIEMDINENMLHAYTCPTTAVIPNIIQAAFGELEKKILSPHIGLSKHLIKTTLQEIGEMGAKLGIKKSIARKAGEKAIAHYNKFIEEYAELGKREFDRLLEKPTVIIAGRPYTTCASNINLALPRKIASRGYNVIPADMLPKLTDRVHNRDVWHFTQQISNAVEHVKINSDLYICLVSCFSCGPDASIFHLVREKLAGHTFCYLEIDSHTAHAGFETRVGAFLDIVEERRRKGADKRLIKESLGGVKV